MSSYKNGPGLFYKHKLAKSSLKPGRELLIRSSQTSGM